MTVVPFFAFAAWSVNEFYIKSNLELTRLDQINRSPIVNFFSETMRGVSVVRASDHQPQFREQSNKYLNKTVETNFALAGTSQWFTLTMSFFTTGVLILTCLYFVISRDVEAALASLVLSYTVTLQESIFWVMRSFTFLESRMVSVERTDAYTKVESEGPFTIEDSHATPEWPSKGEVKFENYSVRYRPGTPRVLKEVTCTINGGEKVGIVGRSGAGKTTVTLALFRILQPDAGRITIDGVDITKVGLDDLRSKISLIPQDPLLFAGTLRFNMDPFDEFSDTELVNCLARVGLRALVESWNDGIQHEISEGGENLSVGERQLVCVARALIRRRKVVLIDEATANVDSANDQLIQESLRNFFAGSTVLTIAHRLNTIMQSNRIMVMSAGEMVEFDTPDNLKDDPLSEFSALIKKQRHSEK